MNIVQHSKVCNIAILYPIPFCRWRKQKNDKYPVIETERGLVNDSAVSMRVIRNTNGDNKPANGGSNEGLDNDIVKPDDGDEGIFSNESATAEIEL